MVINSKFQEITSIHCINLNNRPLPYTMICKYLGHVINNNVTDGDDIAIQKDAFMHKVVFQLKNIEPYAQS